MMGYYSFLDIPPVDGEGDYFRMGHQSSFGCPYLGPDNISQTLTSTWKNSSVGRQVEIMSHYCVNGSASHLGHDDWIKVCFPTYHQQNDLGHKIAGIWGLLVTIIGIIGNSLTLFAVPYAKWKRRHDFHVQFYTTHIWVLHLALAELIWCLIPLPVLFVIPYLGFRYLQAPGMDVVVKACFVIGHQTVYTDWLLLAFIVMTRAIHIKYPKEWKQFCENKIYVTILLLLPWVISTFYILPHVIQPSLDFGYHCLYGYSTYIPTGEEPEPFLVENKWILDLLPGIVAFFLPLIMIIASFVVIWRCIKKVKTRRQSMTTVQRESDGGLTEMEIKFIMTFFFVCLFYVGAAVPLAVAKMFRELRTPASMLVIVSVMFSQYVVNFILYAFRCKQYRAAYWDIIVLMCPKLSDIGNDSNQISTSRRTSRITTSTSFRYNQSQKKKQEKSSIDT